jgi:hypothetical protein
VIVLVVDQAPVPVWQRDCDCTSIVVPTVAGRVMVNAFVVVSLHVVVPVFRKRIA